jgi:hypothetical protein
MTLKLIKSFIYWKNHDPYPRNNDQLTWVIPTGSSEKPEDPKARALWPPSAIRKGHDVRNTINRRISHPQEAETKQL